jgi:tetratricopeptide (TPR) repeat protein
MSNVAKLKKKAAELEQKKQFDKALAVYLQIIEAIGGAEEEGDVALYNRVGDLMIRQGNVGEAVDYYEKAVDLYAEGGFFNNAIALCNKILRNSPGRSSIYYKLGKISAKKGFTSDAKQNFLEYADRMQKANKLDEAFRALKEFADLCPDQDDIRLMLADQLTKRDRKGEALEQLQTLYDKFESEGRGAEARATADRMRAIDPANEPKASGRERAQKSSDLVFLDVNYDEPKHKMGRRTPPRPPIEPPQTKAPAKGPLANLPTLDVDSRPAAESKPIIDPGMSDVTHGAGFDLQSFDAGPPGSGADSILGLESTRIDDTSPYGGGLLDLDPGMISQDPSLSHDVGLIPGLTTGSVEIDLGASEQQRELPAHDLALPGELPMLDLPGEGAPPKGGDLELIMPDDDASGRRASRGVLADLDPPISQDRTAQQSHFEPLDLDIQKDAASSLDPAAADLPLIDTHGADFLVVGGTGAPVSPAPPSLHALRDQVNRQQSDWTLRRRYGEALLESGERDAGLAELEMAMIGYERGGDLDTASSIAEEIIRLNPNSVRHHQKRVEYAFRTQDKGRLVEAYLELADALFRSGQADKAKAVYQRVLELAPDQVRAQAALSAFIEPAAPATPKREPGPRDSGTFRRYVPEPKKAPTPTPAPKAHPMAPPKAPPVPRPMSPKPPPSAHPPVSKAPPVPHPAAPKAQPKTQPKVPGFTPGGEDRSVNLGDLLRDDHGPKSTRIVVAEQEPTGDEAADFADMLRKFKQGVAQNIDDEDHQSHYDLGVAYKEMGLLEEAIAEFQKALRSQENRVRSYEALGQCFLEKSQFQVAATILTRAIGEPGLGDDQLVGVLYLLGYASEALQRWGDALGYYQRVFAVDIQFRDVGERIASLERFAE